MIDANAPEYMRYKQIAQWVERQQALVPQHSHHNMMQQQGPWGGFKNPFDCPTPSTPQAMTSGQQTAPVKARLNKKLLLCED